MEINMSEITKVTVWPATVGYKDGKFVSDASKNKWQIAVFTKGGNMTLSTFVDGKEGDKEIKAYTGIFRHSRAVYMAHKFCVEYGLKEAETKITKELAAATQIVEAEDKEIAKKAAERKANEAFRKAHPEVYATRKYVKDVEELQKVAIESTNLKFKRAVVDISKKGNDLLAQLEAEVAAAEDPAQEELEKAMKAA